MNRGIEWPPHRPVRAPRGPRRAHLVGPIVVLVALVVGCTASRSDPASPGRGAMSAPPAPSVPPATSAPPTSSAPPAEAASGLEWSPLLTDLGLTEPTSRPWRTVYATGFERDDDLEGFYATPQSELTRHGVVAGEQGRSGGRAHHGWLTGATGTEPVDGPNHRGYPTIQLFRRPSGACSSPCLIDVWVRVDASPLVPGEWISLATFSTDGSDRWSRVVTVNIGWEGWLHLGHVPVHGSAERALQRTDLPFPRDQWVRVTTLLDLAPEGGAAAVWQDGVLVSAAEVDDVDADLDQMHFGLYAPPSLTEASVWNDDLTVMTAPG